MKIVTLVTTMITIMTMILLQTSGKHFKSCMQNRTTVCLNIKINNDNYMYVDGIDV